MSKLIRVFARRTNATPDDALSYFDFPSKNFENTENLPIHVSCTFTYDKLRSERLAIMWKKHGVVTLGGPAYGDKGNEFTPGLYLKNGYVFTSRGCPNNCWFCDVPKREGKIRELEIKQGWNLLDSNILACSDQHIKNVFKMLSKQKYCELTGGLESARLKWWHVEELYRLRPRQIFFAYDTPEDLEPLIEAGTKMRYANFTRFHLRCYVLMGFQEDTLVNAQERLFKTWNAGFMPMAMLWKNKRGESKDDWRKLQRQWAKPAFIKTNIHDKIKRGL